MRGSLVLIALAAGCGSKKDADHGPTPTPTPAGPSAAKAGKHERVNGLITNTEGAELCTGLLPEALRTGLVVTGGGEEYRLTCNLKSDGKLLRSAAIDCKRGQSLDAFNADKTAEHAKDQPGLGRAAYTTSSGLVFFAQRVDCTVTIYNFDPSVDPLAFANGIDDVLTPSNTPWPPR